jgi:hypothetical protein
LNSRVYNTPATNNVVNTNMAGEKNQPSAAKEK